MQGYSSLPHVGLPTRYVTISTPGVCYHLPVRALLEPRTEITRALHLCISMFESTTLFSHARSTSIAVYQVPVWYRVPRSTDGLLMAGVTGVVLCTLRIKSGRKHKVGLIHELALTNRYWTQAKRPKEREA